jgi:glycerate-2-kinase
MRDLLEEARQIFFETLKEIDLANVIGEQIRIEDGILTVGDAALEIDAFRMIVVIGIGKASLKMGAAVESLLGNRFSEGVLVTNRRDDTPVRSEVLVAGHPIPNSGSLEAAGRIIELIGSCGSDSLIFFLLSGGGSSLLERPIVPEISLEDLQQLNRLLTECGANIREINIIRKHLSAVKGGRLGFLARRSQTVSLYISDVNEGDLQSIASNPLLPDDVTLDDFFEVLEKYKLRERMPLAINRLISRNEIPALPAKGWNELPRVNIMLLQNSDAMASAAEHARRRGFKVEVHTDLTEGYYRDVADGLLQRLLELHQRFPMETVCLISGGEVSCPVVGGGFGGRSQEFVLYSAARLAELGGRLSGVVLSCGTDGIDGNSNAAGAVSYTGLASTAKAQELEISPFIQGNDSHSFLKQTGGLLFTGPTGNNVRDLRILLASPMAS